MKKTLSLSLILCSLLGASELEPIEVEATTLDDLSGREVESGDLADAISRETPSVTLVRRSGIANDVVLRGQKRDNIAVTVDDTKVFGACPNRMDPPTSHVVNGNIESVKIIDGPYDVETFGTLGGEVKVSTKDPQKGFGGNVDFTLGSFSQRRAAATFTGGNDTVRLLLSGSLEASGQYTDGNGDTMAEQLENYAKVNPMAANKYKYAPAYDDLDAYSKKSLMGKLDVNLAENHLLKLSATVNSSNDILYPSTPMDAIKDDSYIYNAEYVATNLGSFSKELSAQYYHSHVWHPMSNEYRMSAMMMGAVMSNELTTEMNGGKIKNTLDLGSSTELTLGADFSTRNWDGDYKKNGNVVGTSITSTDTKNVALFASAEQNFEALHVSLGARYDATTITPEEYNRMQGIIGSDPWQENDYTGISAYLQSSYALNDTFKLFGGIGRGHRVPDARELYILGKPISTAGDPNMGKQVQVGTPDLDATTNHQADLGVEFAGDMLQSKVKFFYNALSDYIYYNSTKAGANKFTNIDATIYGAELSGSIFVSDNFYVDFGVAYQRGEKDEALAGQSDTDLADIPPLKGSLAFVYEYGLQSSFKIEGVGADTWSNYDEDNGEQEIESYGLINLKLDHRFANGLGMALNVENLFDETYAVSNTYKDLTLISGDTNADVMLINEPGRNIYVNLSYRF